MTTPTPSRYRTRSYGDRWYVDDTHVQPFTNRCISTVGKDCTPLTEAEAHAIADALNTLASKGTTNS